MQEVTRGSCRTVGDEGKLEGRAQSDGFQLAGEKEKFRTESIQQHSRLTRHSLSTATINTILPLETEHAR
jgi:hypothetical protein